MARHLFRGREGDPVVGLFPLGQLGNAPVAPTPPALVVGTQAGGRNLFSSPAADISHKPADGR